MMFQKHVEQMHAQFQSVLSVSFNPASRLAKVGRRFLQGANLHWISPGFRALPTDFTVLSTWPGAWQRLSGRGNESEEPCRHPLPYGSQGPSIK